MPSQINAYLTIAGCNGTSTIQTNAIEIESFSWGIHNAAAAAKASGESRGGKPSFADLHISKYVDPTSQTIMLHCANGESFDNAELVVLKNLHGSNVPYLKFTLTTVYVSSYNVTPAGENPAESISLCYEQFEYQYAPEKPDKKGVQGFVKKKWDVAKNKPV